MFDIRLGKKAEKFCLSCDEKLKARLNAVFVELGSNPAPAKAYDLRKVEGEEHTYRIRLSSHRVIYSVYWDEKIVRVLRIERRSGNTYDF